MNNTKDKLRQNEEFYRDMSLLYKTDKKEFDFMNNIMKVLINREYICAEIVSNKDNHTVIVSIGDYEYKSEYKSLDDAKFLYDIVSNLKQEVY